MNLRSIFPCITLGAVCLALEPPPWAFEQIISGHQLSWDGGVGESYFIQYSTDLIDWGYFPEIENGVGNYQYNFSSTEPRLFVRVKSTDIPTSDPENADFDGDGLSNLFELTSSPQTDPFDFDSDDNGIRDGGEDTDGNGLGDGWEMDHFGSIGQSATADVDNDGLSNFDEYNFATDPNVDSQFGESSSLVHQYDLGKLKNSETNGIQALIFSYSPAGNILTVTTSN